MSARGRTVDLFGRVAAIRRSKTAVTELSLLNGDAMAVLARLLERARARQQRTRALRFPRLRRADYRSLAPAEELAHGGEKIARSVSWA